MVMMCIAVLYSLRNTEIDQAISPELNIPVKKVEEKPKEVEIDVQLKKAESKMLKFSEILAQLVDKMVQASNHAFTQDLNSFNSLKQTGSRISIESFERKL